MKKNYLLDTNAYFALLKYVSSDADNNEEMNSVLEGNCYISRATQIEIISVIGKYARGSSGGTQICERTHKGATQKCGKQYVIPKQKKWSQKKLRDWIRLEKEVSNGVNSLFKVSVLEISEEALNEAESFIQNALYYNFKSMDAIILGTAKANSEENNEMIVVTADKALKAGMDKICYPHISVT